MTDWKKHNVLITGATGLVGSWLTKLMIDEGANVVALVRDAVPRSILWSSSQEFNYIKERLNAVHGSLEDFSTIMRAVSEYEIDTVFHLGAQTIVGTATVDPLHTFEANIRGTYNVLEACHRFAVSSVVMASSDKAYGMQPQPYKETAPLQGRHPYDVSKSCADLLAQSYYHTYGLRVGITRCGNFYGPGDLNYNRLVPGTIRSLLSGERPVIRSDGTPVRDYLYVKDGAAAYKLLAGELHAGKQYGEAFNISVENRMTAKDMVCKIAEIMGISGHAADPIILNRAGGEIREQRLSSQKARNVLGWEPSYGFEDSIRETVEWYKGML